MQVTFMVKLMTKLIDVLESKGYEIGTAGVTEFNIEVLEFSKDSSKYSISITTEDNEQGEYLHLTGTMRKENWCITEDQVLPVLKERRPGDHVIVVSDEADRYFVKMTKNYDAEFDMNGVEKNALKAIAKDILGGIIAL